MVVMMVMVVIMVMVGAPILLLVFLLLLDVQWTDFHYSGRARTLNMLPTAATALSAVKFVLVICHV